MIKQFRRKNKKIDIKSEINVTPFVDIMMVLLVIFMLTSQNIVEGVHINLPKIANTDKMQYNEVKSVKISIDKNEDIYLDDVKVESLEKEIKKISFKNKDIKVIVYGDTKTQYGKVLEIFSIIKNHGIHHISLATFPL